MTKEQIFKKAKENPEHILCLFTKDNFKIAEAFWGKKEMIVVGNCFPHKENVSICQFYLQQMVLAKEPLKYLEKFL